MRALYKCEDLDTQYLSPSMRHVKMGALVQGKRQLVLADFEEIIFLTNVLQLLTDVARVSLKPPLLPILTHNVRWMREDISVVLGEKQEGAVLFHIEEVSTPLSQCRSHPSDPLRRCSKAKRAAARSAAA